MYAFSMKTLNVVVWTIGENAFEKRISVDGALVLERGFQLSGESSTRLLWFCFTALCNWFEKLAPLS